jgi:hypothetical protein
MYQISDKYSGKERRNSIGFLYGKEKERQQLRKKLHPISRDLDNYFNYIHKRGWWPNGAFTRKKYYYYADPGLGCFYEKNNVEQLKDLRELKKESHKNRLKNFIEYKYIEENQYAITIEYCANCEEHKMHTFHKAELYKNYAISLQKCILLRFPFIKVILKPIDTDILKGDIYKLPKVNKEKAPEKKYVNDKFKDVRIGAFEVQICFKKKGEDLKTVLLHSKLQSKQFPEITKVLDKIVNYLPIFYGKIIVYEKEEDKNEITKENNDEDVEKRGLIEGLQINIYLLNNAKISKIASDAWNDVQNEHDPHKRLLKIKQQHIEQKENVYKNESSIKGYFSKNRPMSSVPSFGKYHKSQSMTNLLRPNTTKTLLNMGNANASNLEPSNSSILSNSMAFKSSMNNYILDKEQAKNLKGKLILTKYTNAEGTIDIGPLPYDSYYVEVQESKQYRSVGMYLKFLTLNSKNQNCIKKYIGLFTQENSFIQLHIYEVNKDKNGIEDPVHLANAKVTLKKVSNYSTEETEDNPENNLKNDRNIEQKINLEEKSNTPGILEHTIPPGRYLLEVEKLNYETVRKFIDLEKGANSINVEMSIERYCNLHIYVYNYEKFQEESYVPIQNADVVIYQNSNEVLEESITDNKGEVNYMVSKGEDFLTVVVSKLGYYPVQRVFIRNKDVPINEKGEYEESLIFFLVKENFILENNCILCVTYSSLADVNFDPTGIQISNNLKNKINLSCYDGQKENGIISTFIKYQTAEEMTKTNNQIENQENEVPQNSNNIQDNEINNNNINNDNNIENDNEIENNNEGGDENNGDESGGNKQNEQSQEIENYDSIISLSFVIQTDALRNSNYQDKGFTMNGLERYGCQTIIYMPHNIFYLTAPGYCQEGYCLWNFGWLDVKHQLFYQKNTLTENLEERILYFNSWLEFLQVLIDNKIYLKLFEFFCFDKGILINNERFITENTFIQCLLKLNFCKDNQEDLVTFITSLFKSSNKMISFSLLKKKISSNLKNFSDEAVERRSMDNNYQATTTESKNVGEENNNNEEEMEEKENDE